MLKKSLSLLLCLALLVALPGYGLAAEYTITEQELTELDQIFDQLQNNNNQLSTDLATSKVDLQKVQSQLLLLKDESTKAKQELLIAQSLLNAANQSLEKSEREERAKQRTLKWQRDLWFVGMLYFAIVK